MKSLWTHFYQSYKIKPFESVNNLGVIFETELNLIPHVGNTTNIDCFFVFFNHFKNQSHPVSFSDQLWGPNTCFYL